MTTQKYEEWGVNIIVTLLIISLLSIWGHTTPFTFASGWAGCLIVLSL